MNQCHARLIMPVKFTGMTPWPRTKFYIPLAAFRNDNVIDKVFMHPLFQKLGPYLQ